MAEIKSTLQLALERTQRFSMTEQERENLKQKEISEKASRLFHRYTGGYVTWNEILKEVERTEEPLRPRIREGLLAQLIGALTLESSMDEGQRVLEGIESLTGQSQHAFRGRFETVGLRYREEVERVKEETGIELLHELKSLGIAGSAVEPHYEGNPLYEGKADALRQRYALELVELKKGLSS
jgi:hypothetical protein